MRRIWIWIAIAVAVIVIAVPAGAFGYDQVANGDQAARNVSAAGVELSGLSLEEATAAMAAYEVELAAQPVPFSVDGETVNLAGVDVGLDLDEDAIAAAALEARRSGGFFSDVWQWLESWFTTAEVPVPFTLDAALLDDVLQSWDRSVLDEPAYEGAVVVEDGVPVPEYPAPGQMIDRGLAGPLIVEALEEGAQDPTVLPLTELTPTVTDDDVDQAVATAREIVADPVILTADGDGGGLVFSPTVLASALVSEAVVHSPATVEVSFDSSVLAEAVASRLDGLTTPAVDATFEFDEETKEFTIVPSSPALAVDVDALGAAAFEAATDGGRGTVPMVATQEAAFTTEMAEAMGPITEVSSFTTYHPCCASRVTNIHLIADAVDNAVVMPGEAFSVNEHVGQRTLAKGYVRAGAIIQGELYCCDDPANVGGGTSQFGTTFYNAVFFGCYEDIEHQPHSLYFSRYPFVREATLGYPKPDVIFRNNTDAIVYIDTSYTGTSITVTFYGNNGGRTCESVRDGNTVTRIMHRADGSVEETQEWSWYYRSPKPKTTPTTAPPSSSEPPPSSSEPPPSSSEPPPSTTEPPSTTTTPPTTAATTTTPAP
jgi:vancomycin resistance protein YoaR